jgi:hypothetical protein
MGDRARRSATLTALDALFLAGEDHPVLVLAPLRVARDTWPEEARKWNHLRHVSVMPIVGSESERRAALKYDASVYTTNYENLEWLVELLGERWPFRTVVADELTKLKSFRLRQGGKRAAALAKVAHKKVKRFIGLTGTPSPNGLQDLWGQAWFLDGGVRLGRTYDAFKQRWFQKSHDGFGMKAAAPRPGRDPGQAARHLPDRGPGRLHRHRQEPIVNNIYVDLPPRRAAVPRHGKADVHGAGGPRRGGLQRGGAHDQVPADRQRRGLRRRPGQLEEVHDEKLDALEDVVEEAAGAPVLVAYHFKSDLARLQKAFPQGRVLDADPAWPSRRERGPPWFATRPAPATA